MANNSLRNRVAFHAPSFSVTVPDSVILTMASKFEAPATSEQPFSTELNSTLLADASSTFSVVVSKIAQSFDHPLHDYVREKEEERRKDQKITQENVLHQADLRLRKASGIIIKQVAAAGRVPPALPAALTALKAQVLKDLEQGTLPFPVAHLLHEELYTALVAHFTSESDGLVATIKQ